MLTFTPCPVISKLSNPLLVTQAAVYSGSPWPASISPGQATVRDPSNSESYISDEAGFQQSVQGNSASFAYQIYNLLGAGSWDCLYSGK